MANPLCAIAYAGYTFQNPTLGVDATALYDEAGLSQIGTRYEFKISGWIGGVSQDDLANQVCLIKQACNTPRGSFSVVWTGDGTTTLYSTDATQDIGFGPRPDNLTLLKHSGGRVAQYIWSLTTEIKDCYNGTSGMCAIAGRDGKVLSLTQAFDFSIDENGFTKRTITGKLIVTSDGAPAHSWAAAILPWFPLPKGFARVQQDFKQSADARILDYSIVDQEKMWVMPQPITGGNASFSIKIDPYGARQVYSLRGKFSAPASVSKGTMVLYALALAAQKIPFSNATTTVIPTAVEISESVYDNQIAFFFEAMSSTPGNAPTLATFGGRPVGTDSNNLAQFIGVYGGTGQGGSNSGVLAGNPTILDGCTALSPGSIPTNYQPASISAPPSNDGNDPNGDGGAALQYPDSPGNVSQAQQLAMFIDYREEVTFHVKNNIRMFLPKKAGAAPIFQQTAPPTITVVQRGYAVRVADTSNLGGDGSSGSSGNATPVFKPPDVFFTSDKAQLLDSEYFASNGEPIGTSGWDRFTIRWCYTMVLNTAIQSINQAGLTFPDDPRRTWKGPAINNLPELIVQPPAQQA